MVCTHKANLGENIMEGITIERNLHTQQDKSTYEEREFFRWQNCKE